MIRKNARFNYLILIYLFGIVFFTLFRIAETVVYCSQSTVPDMGSLYWHALWNGFRFDTTVSCYILTLPLVMMIIGEMARIKKRWYYAIIHYLLMVLYTVAFFACAADIPFFCYFFSRLDASALDLTNSFGMAVSMIVSEPMYVVYFFVFLAVSVAWWLLGRWIFKLTVGSGQLTEWLPYGWSIPLALVLLFVGFVGMRGRLAKKSPIRVGTAYFCNNPFLNQIGLNPVFTFIKSIEDAGKSINQKVELIDLATAQAVLDEQRAMPEDNTLPEAAIRLPEGMNVVLVLMESMSVDKTGLHSETTSLTPCLDSLMRRSMTFVDAWSAGIHTHNGIYSTLYGHPAIMARQMIKNTPIPKMCGLPQRLKAAGYRTYYFMPHDELYDNMQSFLYGNGFDRMIGEHSYPKSEVVGTWGVPDHVLFDHVIEHIDSIAGGGPFLATVMTCSDHGPYIVPDGIDFTAKHADDKQKRIVEYADWSIGRFIEMAQEKEWFSNTLFVFIADHGASLNPVYDMALAYNHVPLLFFAPGYIEPHYVERLAMQIDVAPTILGLLGIDAGDRMLGVNLMNHNRDYALFSADDKIGVVDDELLYLYRAKQDRASLYRYRENDTVDLIDRYPDRAEAMRRFGFGLTQMAQEMLTSKSTDCDAQ